MPEEFALLTLKRGKVDRPVSVSMGVSMGVTVAGSRDFTVLRLCVL